jgi:hypothetical protein
MQHSAISPVGGAAIATPSAGHGVQRRIIADRCAVPLAVRRICDAPPGLTWRFLPFDVWDFNRLMVTAAQRSAGRLGSVRSNSVR